MFGRRLVVGVITAAISLTMLSSGVGHATGNKGPMPGVGVFQCNIVGLNFGGGVETQNGPACNGVIAGLDVATDTTPSAVVNVCAPLCNLTVNYNYSEGCAGSLVAPTGEAEGIATVTGATVIGASSSTLVEPFIWLRIGAIAVVRIGKLAGPNKWWPQGNKKKEINGTGTGYKDLVGGISVAAFEAAPTCPDPTKNVTIAGAIVNVA